MNFAVIQSKFPPDKKTCSYNIYLVFGHLSSARRPLVMEEQLLFQLGSSLHCMAL